MSAAITVAVIAASAALAGCGGAGGKTSSSASPVVDQQQVQRLLTQAAIQRDPELTIGQPACPNGIVAQQGGMFTCTLMVEGQPVKYTVTISEMLGTQVNYTFQATQAIVVLTAVSHFVLTQLGAAWMNAKVDCGPGPARILDVGGKIDCTAFNGKTTRYIEATVQDLDGTVALRET